MVDSPEYAAAAYRRLSSTALSRTLSSFDRSRPCKWVSASWAISSNRAWRAAW
jgi:hypothetical protein